ncbi:MAG: hypothetical protein NC181_03245 [Clostridium sp.]|nr:hypothetical protein [Clostridium sp.]MCM1444306.1 hypothetical protein [Candidatus Amulumruptor caecigallinarius]
MNDSSKLIIDELIRGKEYLKSDKLYKRSSNFVKKVLEMEEWNNPKFAGLLTPTIWCSNYQSIKEKLNLLCFSNNKYKNLFTPSIFLLSSKNIVNGIKLFEEYNISEYITICCLRKSTSDLRNLIEYLINNDIDLVVRNSNGEQKLNPILNASKKHLKEKYNIDIKNLNRISEGKIK